MKLEDDIKNQVKNIIDKKFVVTDITYVPTLDGERLNFDTNGLKIEAAVLYIDMRGSTRLLNNHNRKIVAKIHKAYFQTIVKIANSFGGNLRSLHGDSALIFFPSTYRRFIINCR